MAGNDQAKSDTAQTAAHAGTADRDEDRPEPGSALERRQQINSDKTGEGQEAPEAPTPAPDAVKR